MAIACFGEPTAPVRFARDLAIRIRRESPFSLRIGPHNGPVYLSSDINANMNVAGGGINIAQRIMDCGDGGHILLSQSVADTLLQLSHWKDAVQDLGECEVKHGLRLRIFNLSTPEFGNASLPRKLQQASRTGDRKGIDPAPLLAGLAKAADDRRQTALDPNPDHSASEAPASRARPRFVYFLAGVAVTLIAALVLAFQITRKPDVLNYRYSPMETVGGSYAPVWAPDEKAFVYGRATAGKYQVFIRYLSSMTASALGEPSTSQVVPLAWTPDSRRIIISFRIYRRAR